MSDSEATGASTKNRPGGPRQWVEDLNEGDKVGECYAVRKSPERMGGTRGVKVLAGDFKDLTDFTWARGGELREAVGGPGSVIHVEGVYAFHPTFKGQIEITSIRSAEPDEYDPLQLYPAFVQPRAELERRRDALVESLDSERSAHLVQLLEMLIVKGPSAEMWCNVPAPTLREKENRDEDEARDEDSIYGCRHGCMAAAVTAAEAVSEMAKVHGWPHDIAVTLTLLKHIGMVDVLEALEIGFGMTAEGRLEKLPMLGGYILRDAIRQIDGFPEEDARMLGHVPLANAEGTGVKALIRTVSGVCDIVDTTLKDGVFLALEQDSDADALWAPYSDTVGGQVYLGGRSV